MPPGGRLDGVGGGANTGPPVARSGLAGLPVPLTEFIGRVDEQAALAAALQEHRLVTATGPGGVGKTRLCIAVASASAARFADGVTFVDLVNVTDPTMVVTAIADAAGVPERSGMSRREALLATLADAELLLVVDNCEHLLDARECVQDLVHACPRVVVLATSRTRLMLADERVFAVPGLSIGGDGGGDAVALFVARSRSAGASRHVAEEAGGATLQSICQALDGSALAIELAAARVPSFASMVCGGRWTTATTC